MNCTHQIWIWERNYNYIHINLKPQNRTCFSLRLSFMLLHAFYVPSSPLPIIKWSRLWLPPWLVLYKADISLRFLQARSHIVSKYTCAHICNIQSIYQFWALASERTSKKNLEQIVSYLYKRASMWLSQQTQQVPFLAWIHLDPSSDVSALIPAASFISLNTMYKRSVHVETN